MSTPLSDHDLDKMRPDGYGRQLRVRLTPDEDEACRRAAKLSGLSVSAWVRQALREVAERRFINVGEQVPWTKK